MTWEEYEEWLNQPEQKALLPNRHIDKVRAYNQTGPRNYPDGGKAELKHALGGNFEVGKKIPWYADNAKEVFGLPPELAFMHEIIQPEGDIPDIDLPYRGCDYDYRGDPEFILPDEDRVSQYLKQSESS